MFNVRITTEAGSWVVIVDGITRGRFDCVFAATRFARGWGF